MYSNNKKYSGKLTIKIDQNINLPRISMKTPYLSSLLFNLKDFKLMMYVSKINVNFNKFIVCKYRILKQNIDKQR